MIAGVVGLVVAAAVVSTGVVQPFSASVVQGIAPDLPMLVLIAVASAGGPRIGAATGFCTGLLVDLDPMSTLPLGSVALGSMLVGFIAGSVLPDRLTPDRRSSSRMLYGATVLGGCLLSGLACLGVGLVAGSRGAPVETTGRVLAVGLVSAVLALVVVPPMVRLLKRLA